MNGLCKSYIKVLNENFKNIQIIFYGSNIYNEVSSDLDLCLITDKKLSKEEKERLIEFTKNFQKSKNLKIDEEIPFENKLLYTIKDLDDIFINSPFKDNDGRYVYHDIIKSAEFLNSLEMKKRLLLNILTTDHKSYGKLINIKNYEEKAWFEILNMLHNVFNTDLSNIDKILDNLYVNPSNFYASEMYLGYKLANPNKRKYLRKKVKIYSKKLLKSLT